LAESALLSQPSETRILSISLTVSNVFPKIAELFPEALSNGHLLIKIRALYYLALPGKGAYFRRLLARLLPLAPQRQLTHPRPAFARHRLAGKRLVKLIQALASLSPGLLKQRANLPGQLFNTQPERLFEGHCFYLLSLHHNQCSQCLEYPPASRFRLFPALALKFQLGILLLQHLQFSIGFQRHRWPATEWPEPGGFLIFTFLLKALNLQFSLLLQGQLPLLVVGVFVNLDNRRCRMVR